MHPPTSIPRRTFLTLAGALPFVMRAWGAQKKPPVGLELYSVRDALLKDLTGTVRAVAKMGYEVVEFYSPYYSWTPQAATEIRKLMDDLGIRCPSTHNDSRAFMPDGWAKAIELNQILGSRYIVLAGAGRVTGIDGWRTVSDRLNAAAETFKAAGMYAGYHNHQIEWQPVEGQRPMDVIAARTVKDVALQLDVGTCVEAGADPVAWIEAHPGRIKSLHCKDWAPGRGYAVLFGEGAAPWARIFKAAESGGGVEYYLIEQEEGPAAEQLVRAERCLANWKTLTTSAIIAPGVDAAAVIESAWSPRDFVLNLDPDSEEWREAPRVTADRNYLGEPIAGPPTEIRSRWTNENLYLLYINPYDELNLKPDPTPSVETPRLWNWDVAEAFIGSDVERITRYKEFQVSPQSEWVDLDIDRDDPNGQAGMTWNSGYTVKGRVDAGAKIWYGAMRIPFAAIDTRPPEKGRELRIGLYRIAGVNPHRRFYAWQPTGQTSFHVPQAFGTLRLKMR